MTVWSSWSSCQLTCLEGRSFETTGRQARSRAVIIQVMENQGSCPHQVFETQPCKGTQEKTNITKALFYDKPGLKDFQFKFMFASLLVNEKGFTVKNLHLIITAPPPLVLKKAMIKLLLQQKIKSLSLAAEHKSAFLCNIKDANILH